MAEWGRWERKIKAYDARRPTPDGDSAIGRTHDGPAGESALCNLTSLPPRAIAFVAEAYYRETDRQRRQSLVHALWQFRDTAVLPTLAAALREQDDGVWKEALDGIVTIGGAAALRVLKEARESLPAEQRSSVKREWVDEAIGQVQEIRGSG